MALAAVSLNVLASRFAALEQQKGMSRRILSLGYPDIIASPKQLAEIFGEALVSKAQIREDSAEIISWHRLSNFIDEIVESEHFFELLGYQLEVVDVAQARGNEHILDLNEPCPEEFHLRYDLLIDSGTCEHCFNIAQAVKNLANMVSLNGIIYQSNPCSMYNHGFYNLNPTWYYDFYENNGFRIHDLQIVNNPVIKPTFYEYSRYSRFKGIPENSSIMMVAQKNEVQEITWPMQRKYVDNPDLKM